MLFQYVNGDGEPQPVTSADVNDYIREATRRRLHRQAFPHLGRERHRLRPDAERRREKARISLKTVLEPVAEALGNTAGDQPQVLCPSRR